MNLAKHTFFLFGGSFLTKLAAILQEHATLVGQLREISPLSELAAPDSGEIAPWLPVFESMLADSKAEYLILDLQLVRQSLLLCGGHLISASEDSFLKLTRQELSAVNPVLLEEAQLTNAMERLTNVVLKHFSAKKIILLYTNHPNYYLTGTSLRLIETPFVTAAQKNLVAAAEQQFCAKTGCHFIDVSRFYFYQKEEGKPLTDVIYEKECYLDVAEHIFAVMDGTPRQAKRPDFALSLDRYVSYFFTLQRKPQRIFLDVNYFLDRLILCADAEFVASNREELITLSALDWSEPKTALSALDALGSKSPLTVICKAFFAALNSRYNEKGVDYALMFRSGIVPDTLLERLKKEYAPAAKLLPAQINRYNAGYHFAKMRNLDPKPFCTDKTVAEPTAVDIFGSCISRTLFNVQDNDFAVNRYWFHVPPFQTRNQKVDYDPALFPEKPSWTDRLVKLQFENEIFRDIETSGAKWLLIDLYFLISPNNCYYQNCLFGDFDHRISKALKAQKINLVKDPSLFGTHDDLIQAMDPWLKLVKKKYGNRIILVTGQRLDHWLGDDDRIYQLKNKSSACNPLLEKATQYLLDKLNCYCIDIGKFFLPDERGFMRNTPAHKEDLCYFASHDLARYIVDHEPSQKIFDRYPGKIHMEHLRRLAKHNPPAAMQAALPMSELDQAVVNMTSQEISSGFEALSELYDSCDWSQPLKNILKGSNLPTALAKALQNSASKPSSRAVLANDYAPYPLDKHIISGDFGSAPIAKPPAIKIKKIVNDKSHVVLTWAAPAETPVHIFRMDERSPYQQIGISTDGKFSDGTAPADTDCIYTLCTEVFSEGKRVLVGFTPPQKIHTALATPVLRSAVCLNGVNILRWEPVNHADSYRIYHKDSAEHRWELCATVSASEPTIYCEPSKFAQGGQLYTVRAQRNGEAGGFQSGLCALPL